jgi:formate dehydrogenase iron-sulfur subunit
VSKCIGCKACQTACLEWTEEVGVNVGVYDNPHDLTPDSWTLMTEWENPGGGR